ncbi:Kinetochore protein Sos7 coiled-coil domain-containing protein [Madurella fahalii]|uniref:Kinetochore protein Sos7 coiled-coil domain-containing protein n=1 Tax=Madurella fahalii TaxID=1157608 RepID=A0ABQ0G325_9PEZI
MPNATSPADTDVGQRAAKVLSALEGLQSASGQEITILKLSEPISSAISSSTLSDANANANANTNPPARTSDVSTTSLDAPTPSSLEADLAHYKELFAKLRFSYVEQVTKEKFIRAIVGDPPLIVTPQENADLEACNAAAKAELKALKTDVAAMVSGLEARARDLAARYERVRADAAAVAELPGKIAALEERVAELRAAQAPRGRGPGEEDGGSTAAGMDLPLGKTLELVDSKRRELAALERRLEQLGGQVPRKRKEAERLRGEVAALETRKANSAAAAREAKRRRENAQQGGVEDELEARGRWYRASETVLRQVLGLQA